MNRPFSLEEFKSGKKAVTRSGMIAICGGHNPQANKTYEVVGWVNNAIWGWNEKGQSFEDRESYKDLIGMAPEKKTVWVKVFKTARGGQFVVTGGYSTKEMLDKVYNVSDVDDYICTTSFEIEV